MPEGRYLVVALGVEAVVVLAVLVGAVDVAAVLAAREPAERSGRLRSLWVPAWGGLFQGLWPEQPRNSVPKLQGHVLGFRGP